MTQTLPKKAETDQGNDVSITPAQAFAVITAVFPTVFFHKNADIIYVSEKYKSCHGVFCDRTVLQSTVADEYGLFAEYCRNVPEATQVLRRAVALDLPPYRGGVFVRLALCDTAVDMLCLTQTDDELSSVLSLADGYVNGSVCRLLDKRISASDKARLAKIFSLREEEDDMSAYEAYLITRGFSERMNRLHAQALSSVSFNGYADKSNARHVAGLTPASYAAAFTAVLYLLDAVSADKKIDVSFYGGTAVQAEISTEALDIFDVSEYSGYLYGLTSCVRFGLIPLISAAALVEEASLTAEVVMRDGKISVVLTSLGAEYPAMDFKFEDAELCIDDLFDMACAVSCLYDIILPREEV